MTWSALVQQQLVDQAGEPAPTFRLLFQTTNAGFGDAVVLRLAIAFGSLPGALDPSLLFESDEGRVERALIERERRLGDLLESSRQPVRVLRAHGMQRPQHDQIKGALEQLDAFLRFTGHPSGLRTRSLAGFRLIGQVGVELPTDGSTRAAATRRDFSADLAALGAVQPEQPVETTALTAAPGERCSGQLRFAKLTGRFAASGAR